MEDELLDSVIGFDALYESMYKCRKGVSKKGSVSHYVLNGIEETLRLNEELESGNYKPRPKRKVQITHPKPREAICIAFRDRVYQRSMNDTVIYPAISKSLIFDNAACQKGKGTDFMRDRLDEYLRRYFRKHGLAGWVLQTDIHGYYANMQHSAVEQLFERYVPSPICERAQAVLQNQWEGDKGYNPGSQMVQIAGISVLSPLDHFIKEQLHVEGYFRYMDDSIQIHENKAFLESCKAKEAIELAKIGLEMHPQKTRIYPLEDGIKILGFTHKLTSSGKVIRLIDPKNVKSERKKLARMAALVRKGEMSKSKADECYRAWKAHAKQGNSALLLQRMDKYYKSLIWR